MSFPCTLLMDSLLLNGLLESKATCANLLANTPMGTTNFGAMTSSSSRKYRPCASISFVFGFRSSGGCSQPISTKRHTHTVKYVLETVQHLSSILLPLAHQVRL